MCFVSILPCRVFKLIKQLYVTMITPHLSFHGGTSSCTPWSHHSSPVSATKVSAPNEFTSRTPRARRKRGNGFRLALSHLDEWTKVNICFNSGKGRLSKGVLTKTPIFSNPIPQYDLRGICHLLFPGLISDDVKRHLIIKCIHNHPSPRAFLTVLPELRKKAYLKIKIVLTGQHGSTWINMDRHGNPPSK